jgi:hypothetical protein
MILLKTKNIEHAYYYSQKAYYYYLEYLEQVYQSDAENGATFNHMDAILCVYKKTVCEVYDKEAPDSSPMVSNVITLHEEKSDMNNNDLKALLDVLSKFIKTLFFWENPNITIENKYYISCQFLDKYVQNIDALETISCYLETLQDKIEMTFTKYEELLYEMLKKIEKNKPTALTGFNKTDFFLEKIYAHPSNCLVSKFNDCSTKELVKWLFIKEA